MPFPLKFTINGREFDGHGLATIAIEPDGTRIVYGQAAFDCVSEFFDAYYDDEDIEIPLKADVQCLVYHQGAMTQGNFQTTIYELSEIEGTFTAYFTRGNPFAAKPVVPAADWSLPEGPHHEGQ